MAKKKLAVLGGGMGSLSAVYHLTSQPDWQDRYEITVYQMGWRLGGKGASGRDPDNGYRIKEHGFHILFGFYENTFRMMRECYAQLGRSPDQPLAEFIAPTHEDEAKHPTRYAMTRHFSWTLMQKYNESWHPIEFDYPGNNRLPGDGSLGLGAFDYLELLIEDALTWAQGSKYVQGVHEDHLEAALNKLEQAVPHIANEVRTEIASVDRDLAHLHLLRSTFSKLATRHHEPAILKVIYDALIPLLREVLRVLWSAVKPHIDTDWEAYHIWIMLDCFLTTAVGFMADDILWNGFNSVNDLNTWQWFMKHATISEGTELTIQSVLIQASYDSSFAYLNGDSTSPPADKDTKPLPGLPTFEAGTLLRGGMRMMFGWKGSLSWMFGAGCGDVLFAPIYLILKQRGVKFEFFHLVKSLKLAPDDPVIDQIVMVQQAAPANDHPHYEPLFDVKGLPCWPDRPFYDQLANGDALKGVDLESQWADYEPVRTYPLNRGTDFDEVILGISLGALPTICEEIISRSPAWQQMIGAVKTVRTQGTQLWFNKTYHEMGYPKTDPTLDVAVQPMNSYVDMTQQIRVEDWPVEHEPRSIAYFCGAMADDPNESPTPDPAYPPTQVAAVQASMQSYLEDQSKVVWPKALTDQGFEYNWLVDVKNQQGEARLNAQYFRANIDPTERYVLSVPNSSQYRLEAGGSGISNLYLAGDWINTAINAGCMEGAVMSGMLASRAMTGSPAIIPGEHDFDS